MEEIYVKHKVYGKCTLLNEHKGLTLIKLSKGKHKYAVVDGLSIKDNDWRFGAYFKDFEKAKEVFDDVVNTFELLKL